jgi:ubiquinone/menaquinone biosynthesis C-methylase UbiE
MQVYFSGWLYDRGLGPLMHRMRAWISASIRDKELYPVLDLCTGTGMMCRILNAPPYQTLGLDLDDRMLRYARDKAPDVSFIQGDGALLPIQDGVFGSVIISYALHEKTSGIRSAMLKETRRVLRAGGRVYFVDFEKPWNSTSRLGRVFTYSIERLAGGEHFQNSQTFVGQGGLRSFLAGEGWDELDSRAFAWGNSRIVVCSRPD